jgi:hypothetical protein
MQPLGEMNMATTMKTATTDKWMGSGLLPPPGGELRQ